MHMRWPSKKLEMVFVTDYKVICPSARLGARHFQRKYAIQLAGVPSGQRGDVALIHLGRCHHSLHVATDPW